MLTAVAHAHANLVIHRDIKPSNVLVRTHDTDRAGSVTLLDFGIAKLIERDPDTDPEPLLTQESRWAMTPAFAAPEQLTGGTVTTATDVYALGVLLYILLGGQHPAGPGLKSPAELIALVVNTEAPRLSEALTRTKTTGGEEALTTMAEAQGDVAGSLAPRAEGRSRNDRRHRAEKGSARTVSDGAGAGRRPAALSRSAADSRAPGHAHVSNADVCQTALAGGRGRGGGLGQRGRADRLLHDAAPGRTRSRAAGSGEGGAHDRVHDRPAAPPPIRMPIARGEGEPTVRELLDAGAARVERELAGRPELQADIMTVIGRVYQRLNLNDKARPLLEHGARAGA